MFKRTLSFAIAAICSLPVMGQEAIEVAEVNQSTDMINGLFQSQWVRIDENGTMSGTVVTLTPDGKPEPRVNASVLLSSRGVVMVDAKTDSNGKFSFSGISVGTYSLQVLGDMTRAAYAVHVLPASAEHLPSATEMEICAAAVPSELIAGILAESIIPSSDTANSYRVFEEDPLAGARSWHNSHEVALVDGVLNGRVSKAGMSFSEQDLGGTLAYLIREREVIARVPVSSRGEFSFANVTPGVYAAVVAGEDGVAIVGFEAISPMQSAALANGSTFVSALQAGGINLELSNSQDATVIIGPPGPGGPVGPPPGPGFAGGGGFYGGGGGGGFGGGGGGGGFGGAGGALGIAGLALGITALADDDDGFNNGVATPISP